MKLPRRQFLHLAASAAALPAASQIAKGQAYPTRPVRLIIGIAPGSAPDILGRLMAQWLSERLGQAFIIENRPGGGGNIAIEAVVNASADGYTLLLATIQGAVNATLYEKLNYNFIRDIAPVAAISRETLALRSIHRFRPRRFLNSSLMPRPIRASSPWRRPASGPRLMWRASYSR
jgi:tripartite-type tricarboxylate transporter receptor subunit TctC